MLFQSKSQRLLQCSPGPELHKCPQSSSEMALCSGQWVVGKGLHQGTPGTPNQDPITWVCPHPSALPAHSRHSKAPRHEWVLGSD